MTRQTPPLPLPSLLRGPRGVEDSVGWKWGGQLPLAQRLGSRHSRSAVRGHLRVQLRELEGDVLSRRPSSRSHAPLLLRATERRRAERKLLPYAATLNAGQVGGWRAAGLPFLHEGSSRAHVFGRRIRSRRAGSDLRRAYGSSEWSPRPDPAAVSTGAPAQRDAAGLAARCPWSPSRGRVPARVVVSSGNLPRPPRAWRSVGGHRRGEVAAGAPDGDRTGCVFPVAARLYAAIAQALAGRDQGRRWQSRRGACLLQARSALARPGAPRTALSPLSPHGERARVRG